MQKIKTFREAENFLDQFIPKTNTALFAAGFGLSRMKEFLRLLGNPQNNLKTIHIAGTSGKGSTAYLTSIALKSQGFTTGLFLSPHLTTVRERIQINNTNISEKQFVQWISFFIPFIETMKRTQYGAPSWFEIVTAIAFCEFYTKKVDYAVIETGLGGLYDSTNTIENKDKLVILTKIGFDHMHVLGNTLEKIASHKAGIIQKVNTVIPIYQKPPARKVIDTKVKKEHANLYFIEKDNIQNIELHDYGTVFDLKTYNLELSSLHLGLLGKYQAENASLALAATKFLSERDGFEFQENKLRDAFKSAHFIGRFETKIVNGKTIIIDGAHNPQKMQSFISSLSNLYPNQQFNFLISFKKGKEYPEMLQEIIPVAKHIIVTEFKSQQEFSPIAENAEKLAIILANDGMKNFKVIPNLKKAFKESLKLDGITVATGSLYFLCDLFKIIKF